MEFERIVSEYPVRRSAQQKRAFCDAAEKAFEESGFSTMRFLTRRKGECLVAGNPERAHVLFCAHYDTAIGSRFPMKFSISKKLSAIVKTGFYLFRYALFRKGSNPTNHNDNSSGVFCVMELAKRLAGKEVAFVLFDDEEKDSLGAKQFFEQFDVSCPVINLDCVGDGTTFFVVFDTKEKEKIAKEVAACLPTPAFAYRCGKILYPSDHLESKTGVCISSFWNEGSFAPFLDKLHSKEDSFADLKKMHALCDALEGFTKRNV